MSNLFFAATEAAQESAASSFGGVCDLVVFFLFLAAVIFVAFGMSRNSAGDSESYFLAGRGLKWWLIGFSLIAANISAEQFVGMSGNGSDYIGLAVASYEWIAALSLVIVAFFFLPRFLKAGIYTIPQYLETRYNRGARTIMSIFMMIMLVAVNITIVTYAGAKAYAVFFQGQEFAGMSLDLSFFCWLIGIFAALYIFAGGLKACAWADLLQGSALIVAGAVVLYFSMRQLGSADPVVLAQGAGIAEGTPEFSDFVQSLSGGAMDRFQALNADKLRMNLPKWDLVLPVTALIFGIWIPNLYYWGLNQYIIQRTLGAKSLGEGQKGLVFAAFMKLIIPFIVIFPGMIAFNLFHADMNKTALEHSASELERFEQLAANPDPSQPLFLFNRSYVAFAPDKAREMLEYDAKALGVEVPNVKTEGRENMAVEDEYLLALMDLQKKAPKDVVWGEGNVTISGYDTDSAFPLLMSKVIPTGGFKGFMLAALLGAIISSVAAMLNAASTIFTMDIFNEYILSKKIEGEARQKKLVAIGRLAVVVFVLIGCIVAPIWADPKYRGVFTAIQEFQGYISPGIFAAFVVGFWMKKAPNSYGVVALVGCPILYFLFSKFVPELDFLNRMGVVFGILIVAAFIMRFISPRKEAFVQPMPEYPTEAALDAELATALAADGVSEEEKTRLTNLRSRKMSAEKWTDFLKDSKNAKIFGIVVVVLTILLYIKYWA
ncbi:MAG: sodium/solute symporter [Thermoguttaceae bacterium]